METRLTLENGDSPHSQTAANDADHEAPRQEIALEPDTLPNHPLRAQDVPGFIPKLID